MPEQVNQEEKSGSDENQNENKQHQRVSIQPNLINPDKQQESIAKHTNENIGVKNIGLIKDHYNNQSTDCDDIVPQFKNNNQNHFKQTNIQMINDTEQKAQNQLSLNNKEESKNEQNLPNQSAVNEDKRQKQNHSSSSSPSSTSSEEVKNHNSSSSQNSKPSTPIDSQNNSSHSQEENKQVLQKSLQKQEYYQSLDSNDNAQIENKKVLLHYANYNQMQNSESEEKKQEEESSDNDSDVEEDDEDQTVSQSSIVVEVSPKGRFKRFGEELGRGAYKIVYKGVDNETGREIAWNVINLNRLPKQDRVRIKSEIELIKKLQHKNIIHFISAWFNKEREQVVFITEMITGGSLRKYVKKIKTPRLKVIKGWCHEILQGLVYLHEQKPHPIIHRDLKCDNIFINSNSGEIRIGDLGLSTPMTNSFTTSVLGTPEFMAPELYEECYDTSVDIYAFGMCVLEMITLERPYKECQNPAQIYNKVVQGILPKSIERIEDEEVKQFILQCLKKADERPAAKDLLESKFLNDLEGESNNHEVKMKPLLRDKKLKQKKRSIYYKQRQGSTILEEEEENSEESKSFNKKQEQELQENYKKQEEEKVIEQPQPQGQIEDHKIQPENAENVQIKEIREVPQKQPQESIYQDSQQITSLIQDKQTEEVKDQNQNNGLQEDKQDNESQQKNDIIKKKMKNQKLNESVNFLKQKDKEKQRKLQERTLLQQQIEDDNKNDNSSYNNDSDADTTKIQENILDELRQQDLQNEKRDQQLYHSQLALKDQTKFQDQHHLNIHSQSQDSQHIGSSQSTQQSVFHNQQQNLLDQVVEKKKIDIKKNFKEDQQPLNRNQGPQVPQNLQIKKLDSNPTNKLNEEKKSINKEQQIQHINPIIYQQEHKGQQQIINDNKKKDAIIHSQHSDIVHLNAPLTNIQKTQHGGSYAIEGIKEQVFDDQSSSDSQSQEKDSEVDNIKLPKVQYEEQLKGQSYNQNVYDQQHKYPLLQDLKKTQHPTKTPQNHQLPQFSPIQVHPQIQSLQQIQQLKNNTKPEQERQQPKQHMEQQKEIVKQTQHQLQQQVMQQQKPLTKKEDTQTPSQQQNQQHFAKQTHKPQGNIQVIISLDNVQLKDNKINMSFKIKSYDGGPEKEVTFDFDINGDTPQGVAYEMVKELQLSQSYIDIISKQIWQAIEKIKQHQLDQQKHHKSQQQSVQHPQVPQQQQPNQIVSQQNKKKSPAKLTKEAATNYFNQLFEGIDQFFQVLQSKGIESFDEIIETLDVSQDEKKIRLEFLNNVYKAKKTYKINMEQYKQKIHNRKKPVQQQTQINEPHTQKSKHDKNAFTDMVQGQKPQMKQSDGQRISVVVEQQMHQQDKIIYQYPNYMRKHFRIIPQQFSCAQRLLSGNLKKAHEEPLSPDEEVASLQHMLNMIFSYTVISLQQKVNPSESDKQAIQNYLPLKIDGFFGDKTEQYVMKIQKYLQMTNDGQVNDLLWKELLKMVEDISNTSFGEDIVIKDPKKNIAQTQVHTNPINKPQQSQQQQQQATPQINTNQIVNNHHQSQPNHQFQQQVQKVYQGQPTIQKISNTQQQQQQHIHKQTLSPLKKKPSVHHMNDIDYKVIEQFFHHDIVDNDHNNEKSNDEDDDDYTNDN